MKSMGKQTGYTLVEIMIVAAIAAILSNVALASYCEHVRRSQRLAARAVMLEAANWMERRFSVHHNYLGSDKLPPVLPDGLNRSPPSGTAKYAISLATGQTHATAYQLQAAPLLADKCGTFTLDHTGARGLIGNTASLAECWGR
jgi:type IV pilus assembly protein PilE